MAKKILIVDDDPQNQRLVEYYLREEGFEIFLAGSARSALRYLNGQAFDLVLSDIQMPETSGPELIDIMRARGIATPVVLLTAFNIDEARNKWQQTTAFLQKPFEKRTLLEMLRQIFREY